MSSSVEAIAMASDRQLSAEDVDADNAIAINETSSSTNASDGALRGAIDVSKLAVIAAYTVAYAVVFLLALVNNGAVLIVIGRNPQMRTVTNYFIANLALADLIVSFIVLPITLLSNIFNEWIFSWFLCKAIPYLQAVAVSASVNTLTAVAIERYCVIFYPAKTIITVSRAVAIIAFIWMVPIVIQTPWIYYQKLSEFPNRGLQCYSEDTRFFFAVVFVICYLLPLLIIIIFYSIIGVKVCGRNVSGIRGSQTERNIHASKIRIVRMLVTVAAVFALSWLPLYSVRLRLLFGPKLHKEERVLLHYLSPIFQWLGSANSCVNPFIYCFFSYQFRGSIVAVLKRAASVILPCCCKSAPITKWPQMSTKETRRRPTHDNNGIDARDCRDADLCATRCQSDERQLNNKKQNTMVDL